MVSIKILGGGGGLKPALRDPNLALGFCHGSKHTAEYYLSIKFSSKSNKNIIQKINKGFTNFCKTIIYNFCTHQKWKKHVHRYIRAL